MKNNRVTRRTVIKGLGGVTIGLPLLEEMLAKADLASPIPVRAFNVFFGLGIPAPIQQEGFAREQVMLRALLALKRDVQRLQVYVFDCSLFLKRL